MTGVGILGTEVILKARTRPGAARSGPCCPVLRLFWNLPPPQGRRLLCRWAACLTSGLPGVTGCSPEGPRRRVNPS